LNHVTTSKERGMRGFMGLVLCRGGWVDHACAGIVLSKRFEKYCTVEAV
jgi:hypothetical protein